MDFALKAGLTEEKAATVTTEQTAAAVGSGSLPVYATPMMAALMEGAASALVDAAVAEDWTSVGTRLDVEHIAATPVGMAVRARAELQAVEGRKLVFLVEAFDADGPIGRGRHERFLVRRASFLAKASAKGSPE